MSFGCSFGKRRNKGAIAISTSMRLGADAIVNTAAE